MITEWRPCESVKWWVIGPLIVILNPGGDLFVLDDEHAHVWQCLSSGGDIGRLDGLNVELIMAEFALNRCLQRPKKGTTETRDHRN